MRGLKLFCGVCFSFQGSVEELPAVEKVMFLLGGGLRVFSFVFSIVCFSCFSVGVLGWVQNFFFFLLFLEL